MITLHDLEICHSLANEAREIRERIDEIRCMAERCTPVYSRTPKGIGLSDKVADGAIEMADYFAEREEVAKKYTRHVRMVELAIDELEDSEERRVMRMWYVDGLMPSEIMAVMYLSRRTVYYRREEALKHLGIADEDLHTVARDPDV
ncbi:DUF1492 domain-containing protein [Eubacteriales bacterium OttesenSCG-928-A19]|nr:DUF1492 domain-containing protein [Eubacteriales bacterium OttesenSCG-928-A19]